TGRPRITDFGLAKVTGGEADMTQSGNILGTPKYMSPEQAEGKLTIGPPCDVYALGGILYFMLTGQPPFSGSSLSQIVMQVMNAEPPSPRDLTPEVPEALAEVCRRSLAKAPEARYPSAASMAEALRSMHSVTVNQPPSTPEVALEPAPELPPEPQPEPRRL